MLKLLFEKFILVSNVEQCRTFEEKDFFISALYFLFLYLKNFFLVLLLFSILIYCLFVFVFSKLF